MAETGLKFNPECKRSVVAGAMRAGHNTSEPVAECLGRDSQRKK